MTDATTSACKPLVSIVIAVRNGGSTIARAIRSIQCQSYANIEVIVIDGASEDDTIDVVSSFESIEHIVSEPDDGIADAWNKGLRLASGTVIGLLNCDDMYHPKLIEKAVRSLDCDRAMIALGDTVLFDHKLSVVGFVEGCVQDSFFGGMGFYHTSCFATRAAYEQVGTFDSSYGIASDTDWLLRAVRSGVEFVHHGGRNCMQTGGISSIRHRAARREFLEQLAKHGFSDSRTPLRRALGKFKRELLGIPNLRRVYRATRLQIRFLILALVNLGLTIAAHPIIRCWLLRTMGWSIGKNVAIHGGVRLLGFKRVSIGENTTINHRVTLDNRAEIRIGRCVMVARECQIITAGHDIDCPLFSSFVDSVEVEDYAVLFSGVKIMPGVHIGRAAVALPFAVVTKNIDEGQIVGGVPASLVSHRRCDPHYKLYYRYFLAT